MLYRILTLAVICLLGALAVLRPSIFPGWLNKVLAALAAAIGLGLTAWPVLREEPIPSVLQIILYLLATGLVATVLGVAVITSIVRGPADKQEQIRTCLAVAMDILVSHSRISTKTLRQEIEARICKSISDEVFEKTIKTLERAGAIQREQ